MPEGFSSLVVVVVVAALAPIIVDLIPGRARFPQVVILIAGGVLVGPEILNLAQPNAVELFSAIGLGFLFLMAGYEFDPALMRTHAGHVAIRAWVVSFGGAFAVLAVLAFMHEGTSPLVIAIALTTTALGTLLPILRDNGMLGGRFGPFILSAGAVGEIGPILAMALLLGTSGTLVELVALLVMLTFALLAVRFQRVFDGTRIGAIILEREHSTSQTTLRIAIALLFFLLATSAYFGFDSVLGAFVAGMVLRAWSPGDIERLESKLDAVGYGFFIPIFFIASGLTLDVDSIAGSPIRVLVFCALIFAVRGLPNLFWYRKDLPKPDRWRMVFLTATTLPMLVALTQVSVDNGRMTSGTQATIIGAGVLSVLVFPVIAVGIKGRAGRTRAEAQRRMDFS